MSSDALSEVLRAVRLTGAVFYDVHTSSPWVAEAPAARAIAHHVMPGAQHVIEYHVIHEGTCWGGIAGEEPVRLEPGDVIAFPQGDSHVLSSAPGMRGHASVDLAERAAAGPLPFVIQQGGGGPERGHLVCGFFGCDARPFNPLLAALPRMIHVPMRGGDGVWLGHVIGLAVAESSARGSGSDCVLARLSELLFVEIVRRYLATLPAGHTGWLAGLRDEHVGRALVHLHGKPAHPWTLDELAGEVGLSRSSLADRFMGFVGTPPIQYLTQWRMQLAANLLSGSSGSLAEIASEIGYGSEAAFSRAFKKAVGVPPATWRQARTS
jgi:AraC-like DNA-binding protein